MTVVLHTFILFCVVSALSSQVIVENLATKNQTLLEGLSGAVTCAAVSPDGRRVIAGSGNDVAKASDLPDGASPQCLVAWEYNIEGAYWCEKAHLTFERGALLPVSCVAFDTTGQFVAAVGVNGSGGLRGELFEYFKNIVSANW